jgi:hypothetical protein
MSWGEHNKSPAGLAGPRLGAQRMKSPQKADTYSLRQSTRVRRGSKLLKLSRRICGLVFNQHLSDYQAVEKTPMANRGLERGQCGTKASTNKCPTTRQRSVTH